MNCRRSSLTTGGDSTVRIIPLIRKSGEAPVCKRTSEAPWSTANRISWSKFMDDPLSEGRMNTSSEIAPEHFGHAALRIPAGGVIRQLERMTRPILERRIIKSGWIAGKHDFALALEQGREK